jgi:hypothetical protein
MKYRASNSPPEHFVFIRLMAVAAVMTARSKLHDRTGLIESKYSLPLSHVDHAIFFGVLPCDTVRSRWLNRAASPASHSPPRRDAENRSTCAGFNGA